MRIDPARPDVETQVYGHPGVDLGGVEWSRQRKTLTCASDVTHRIQQQFFDKPTAACSRGRAPNCPACR